MGTLNFQSVILICFLCISVKLFGQITDVVKMDTVTVVPKSISLKNINLYDSTSLDVIDGIGRFKALTIFDNELGSQFWASEEPTCIKFSLDKNYSYPNQTYLNVSWDKISGGCKWLGIGFGWDFWQPKDISDILDSANIVLTLSSTKDTLNHLPLAFALEDYSGKQCYVGFNRAFLKSKILPGQWTELKIPLNKFPFEKSKANPDQIKQFIIQFEAEGSFLIDKIRFERRSKIQQ